MNYLSRKRRELTKNNVIINRPVTAIGEEGKAFLSRPAGVHINKLKIAGNTIQDGTPTPDTPAVINNAGDNGLEIKLRGLNLAYCTLANKSGYGAISTILSINSFSYNSTNTLSTMYVSFNIPVKPKTTYTFSCKYTRSGDFMDPMIVEFYSSNSSRGGLKSIFATARGTTEATGALKRTFTSTSYPYIAIAFHLSHGRPVSEGASILIEDFMIVEGTEELPFEPYVEPQTVAAPVPLAGLGEYRDIFKVDRDNKTIKKQPCVANYVFTGQEGVVSGADGVNTVFEVSLPFYVKDNTKYLCTHFNAYCNDVSSYENLIELSYNKAYIYNSPFADLEELKGFFEENQVQIAYVPNDEPIELDYSRESFARELFNLKPTNGSNAILEILGNVAPSEIEATYYTLNT